MGRIDGKRNAGRNAALTPAPVVDAADSQPATVGVGGRGAFGPCGPSLAWRLALAEADPEPVRDCTWDAEALDAAADAAAIAAAAAAAAAAAVCVEDDEDRLRCAACCREFRLESLEFRRTASARETSGMGVSIIPAPLSPRQEHAPPPPPQVQAQKGWGVMVRERIGGVPRCMAEGHTDEDGPMLPPPPPPPPPPPQPPPVLAQECTSVPAPALLLLFLRAKPAAPLEPATAAAACAEVEAAARSMRCSATHSCGG